ESFWSRLSGPRQHGALESARHEPARQRALALRRPGGRPHARDRAGRGARGARRLSRYDHEPRCPDASGHRPTRRCGGRRRGRAAGGGRAVGPACRITRVTPRSGPRQPPLVNNPISALRGGTPQTIVPGEQLAFADVLQRFAAGQPVSASTFASLVLDKPTMAAAAPPPPKCFGWSLASPIFDDGAIIAFGSQDKLPAVLAAFARLKFKRGPLDDAVVFETGEFQYVRFYLWIPRRFANNVVVV